MKYTSIRPFLKYLLGQKCIFKFQTYTIHSFGGSGLTLMPLNMGQPFVKDILAEEIEPILTRISEISQSHLLELIKIQCHNGGDNISIGWHNSEIINWSYKIWDEPDQKWVHYDRCQTSFSQLHPLQVIYLFDKGYDILNLIGSGLATVA